MAGRGKKFLYFFPILFLSFVVLHIIPYCILPIGHFNFRIWEAVTANSFFFKNIRFYPNLKVQKLVQGDLGHNTKFAQYRQIEWELDQYGFRNDQTTSVQKASIILIGDSCLVGASSSQNHILSNQIKNLQQFLHFQKHPLRIKHRLNV